MDNIFYRTLLNDKIKIEPKYISRQFRKNILSNLKATVEGICTKHGFIKEGSVELFKVSPGNVDLTGLNGYVVFDTYYYADVCNPMIGNIVKATVMNVNKFGILADVMGILEIVISKNSVSIVHDAGIDIDAIKIGDAILVEVIGKKFELSDKKISIVGRIVSDGKSVSQRKRDDKDKLEDDDDANDDLIQEEDEDIVKSDAGEESNDEEEDEDFESSLGDDDAYQGGAKDSHFFESDEEDDEVVEEEEYDAYSEDDDKVDFSDGEDEF